MTDTSSDGLGVPSGFSVSDASTVTFGQQTSSEIDEQRVTPGTRAVRSMVASSSSGLRRSTSVPGFGTVVHSVHPKPLPLPQSSPKVKQTGVVKSKTPTRGRTPPPAVPSATLSGASGPSGVGPSDTTVAIAVAPVPTAVANGADVDMVTPAGAPGVSDPSGGASGEGPVVDQGGTELSADQQLDALIAAHNAVQKNPPRKGASPLPLPKFAQLPNADGGGLATLAGAGHPPEAAAAAALPPVSALPLSAAAPVFTPQAHAGSVGPGAVRRDG